MNLASIESAVIALLDNRERHSTRDDTMIYTRTCDATTDCSAADRALIHFIRGAVYFYNGNNTEAEPLLAKSVCILVLNINVR